MSPAVLPRVRGDVGRLYTVLQAAALVRDGERGGRVATLSQPPSSCVKGRPSGTDDGAGDATGMPPPSLRRAISCRRLVTMLGATLSPR